MNKLEPREQRYFTRKRRLRFIKRERAWLRLLNDYARI